MFNKRQKNEALHWSHVIKDHNRKNREKEKKPKFIGYIYLMESIIHLEIL